MAGLSCCVLKVMGDVSPLLYQGALFPHPFKMSGIDLPGQLKRITTLQHVFLGGYLGIALGAPTIVGSIFFEITGSSLSSPKST